jgi:hypothetical protein
MGTSAEIFDRRRHSASSKAVEIGGEIIRNRTALMLLTEWLARCLCKFDSISSWHLPSLVRGGCHSFQWLSV